MNTLEHIRFLLHQAALQQAILKEKRFSFFKKGIGDYAEHDQFIDVNVPTLRTIAKAFQDLPLSEIQTLIDSPINEERLLALFILIHQYQKATSNIKDELCKFYLQNLKQVNNWNLVDSSAHLIIGAHLFKKDKDILLTLATSDIMWERRIAIVATWYFIRHDDLAWTFKIAEILLTANHDLIHKAVGWMLREAGKRDVGQLITFLDHYAGCMPRTMLRYAIEKFPEQQRKSYLMKAKQ